ncbi:ATP-binding protein [Haloarcula marina]|uniref:ATP-binding protein n=1 Tax=Haloarcula marina TaxID=2961574 RepID=UPI0020B6A290|nr:ATP-binding protein [Halomicroarcula marina]
MHYGFELEDEDIRRFSTHKTVEFFRKLLWAEASDTEIIQSSTHVPQRIHVKDGGIDAKVVDATPSREDLIPSGTSGYQIKSSDLPPRKCRNEVTKDTDSTALKPRVERLLDQGGTYVLVIFEELVGKPSKDGKDKLETRKEALVKEFADHGYPNADVRVYDTAKLIGIINRFPALVAQEKGLHHVQDHNIWKPRATQGAEKFVADGKRDSQIQTIQQAVRQPSNLCPVIRVTGQPGVGKTRLVFEALNEDDLRNRVIHATAREFDCSGVASRLQADPEWSAIIVVDECSPDDHNHFNDQFGSRDDRLTLITISSDPSPVNADHEIEVEPLDRETTIKLLKENLNNA